MDYLISCHVNTDEVPGLHVRSKTGGRTRYMVLAVLTDMSPLSDFPADGYTNFVDYNRRKYGVEVKDKEQPLWMALPSKRIPAAHHKVNVTIQLMCYLQVECYLLKI